MPDLCFYAPWIMKEPIPDPFRMMLEKAGKKRISYDEADCSMRNIRKEKYRAFMGLRYMLF